MVRELRAKSIIIRKSFKLLENNKVKTAFIIIMVYGPIGPAWHDSGFSSWTRNPYCLVHASRTNPRTSITRAKLELRENLLFSSLKNIINEMKSIIPTTYRYKINQYHRHSTHNFFLIIYYFSFIGSLEQIIFNFNFKFICLWMNLST